MKLRLRWLTGLKTPHCYHLVIIKSAFPVQFLAVTAFRSFPAIVDFGIYVLDLF